MAVVPQFSISRWEVASSSTPDSNVTLRSTGSEPVWPSGWGGPAHLRRWPLIISAGPTIGCVKASGSPSSGAALQMHKINRLLHTTLAHSYAPPANCALREVEHVVGCFEQYTGYMPLHSMEIKFVTSAIYIGHTYLRRVWQVTMYVHVHWSVCVSFIHMPST